MKEIRKNNTIIGFIVMLLLSSIIYIPGFISLQKLFLFLSIFLSLLFFLFKLFKREIYFRDIKYVLLFFILLMFFSYLSIFSSNYQYLSFFRWVIIFLYSFVFIVIVANDSKPYLSLDISIKSIVIFASFLSFYGVFINVFGSVKSFDGYLVGSINILGLELMQCTNEGGRICSLTANPNTFASLLVFALPCLAYLFYQNTVSRIYIGLSFFIMIYALVLTDSRASLISVLASLFFYFIFKSKNIKDFIIKFIFIVVLFIPVLIYIVSFFYKGRSGLSGRSDAWVLLFEDFNSNLIFGSGFGVSSESVLQAGGVSISGHNIYLTLLSEIGLLGFTSFVCLFFVFLYYSVRLLKSGSSSFINIGALTFTISIGLFFHQFFETILFRFTALHFIWLFFSLNSILIYNTRKRYKSV